MKMLGLLGGMSWESTVPYYREINQTVKTRLGGLHSAKLLLYSVDFYDIERQQAAGDWDAAGALLGHAGRALETAGAEGLVLCTNTMHKVAAGIEAAVRIPLLHIADPTADAIHAQGLTTVGLLGTRFTMEQDFYRRRITQRHGAVVLTPSAIDRECIHRIIYEELCLGTLLASSRETCRRIIGDLVTQGAQAVILGCTELSLLIIASDSTVPLYDTTALHARHAAEWSLESGATDI
jgi:aspartate racemase